MLPWRTGIPRAWRCRRLPAGRLEAVSGRAPVFVAIIATGVRTADRPSQHLQLASSYLTRRASMMRVIHRLWERVEAAETTAGELDLSTASGGFYGFMETGRSWYESAIRSQRVKDAVERNVRAGKRTGGGVQAVRIQDHPP